MAIRRHTVRRGDSLWGLACQYLGNGNRWPEIYDAHNKEVARHSAGGLLFPIENENLIFVGQQIFVPAPTKTAVPATGTGPGSIQATAPGAGIIPLPMTTATTAVPKTGGKAEGGKSAIPLSLKVAYTIGRDTPPILYVQNYGAFTIKAELSGEIAIEISSMDRYRHSLELFMSKNGSLQAKQKLHDAYDPAIHALTAKPVMSYDSESGRVKIDAPIAAKAKLGLFEIDVRYAGPMLMSGSIKPPTISGSFEANQRSYTFSADIGFEVNVIGHQRPGSGPEPVKDTVPKNIPVNNPGGKQIDWSKFVEYADEFIAVVTITLLTFFTPAIRMSGATATTSFVPFHHSIDPRRFAGSAET